MPLVNERDTSLGAKSALQQKYETLYDPPVNGETPLDGAGNPRTSVIHGPDVEAKLRVGFTREPVVAAPPEPAKEDRPKRAKK